MKALSILLCPLVCTAPLFLVSADEASDSLIREIVANHAKPLDPYTSTSVSDAKEKGLLRKLKPSDYVKAAEILIKPKQEHLSGVTYIFVMKWVVSSPPEAYQFLTATAPALVTGNVVDALFEEWAYRDLEGALEAAKQFTADERALLIVLRIMAADAPERAMARLDTNNGHDGFAIHDILVQWAAVDPEKAAAWVLAQRNHREWIGVLSFAWAAVDREAAKAWAKTLNAEDNTIAWTNFIGQELISYTDKQGEPEKAAHEFSEHFPKPALDQETFSNQAITGLASWIANEWALIPNEQPKAMEWVLTLPDKDQRGQMAASIVTAWAKSDFNVAFGFISGLPQGRVKDSGLEIISYQFARKEPAHSFEVAQSIRDENKRERALIALFDVWLRISPQEAMDALAKLPEKERRDVMEYLKGKAARTPRGAGD